MSATAIERPRDRPRRPAEEQSIARITADGLEAVDLAALLDRLTHHVNILEMNGESYRLAQGRGRKPTDTP